jgi:predicted HD phosphohydrolase
VATVLAERHPDDEELQVAGLVHDIGQEAAVFEQDPDFEAAVALRRADDAGKVVGLRVPGLAHWRPTVEHVAASATADGGGLAP